MGESLFLKLFNVLSRQKKSDISSAPEMTGTASPLARIGLASTVGEQDTGPAGHQFISTAAADETPGMHADQSAQPGGIEFFAELPLQQSADEIISVSRQANNCTAAEVSQTADGAWTVRVTLSMLPVPQQIHTVETIFDFWAGKLGGSAKGWGLSQPGSAT